MYNNDLCVRVRACACVCCDLTTDYVDELFGGKMYACLRASPCAHCLIVCILIHVRIQKYAALFGY